MEIVFRRNNVSDTVFLVVDVSANLNPQDKTKKAILVLKEAMHQKTALQL